MIVSRQGYAHYSDGINNQDYYFSEGNLKMVLDGCSGAQFAEIGTRLFSQIFSKLPDRLKPECFESNVQNAMDGILDFFSVWYHTQRELEELIMDNLLFTIIACFETDDSYIVKMFGDGYIVTVNKYDKVSYMKFYYGDKPPYFAYKYCEGHRFKDYDFKTYTFSKELFKKVGVATDGIVPIVKETFESSFDEYIISDSEVQAKGTILANRNFFGDDVTILI